MQLMKRKDLIPSTVRPSIGLKPSRLSLTALSFSQRFPAKDKHGKVVLSKDGKPVILTKRTVCLSDEKGDVRVWWKTGHGNWTHQEESRQPQRGTRKRTFKRAKAVGPLHTSDRQVPIAFSHKSVTRWVTLNDAEFKCYLAQLHIDFDSLTF